MKTLTLVLNFILLGVVGLSLLSGGFPDETRSVVLMLSATALAIVNIVLIAGSSIQPEWFRLKGIAAQSEKTGWSGFSFVKMIVVILNLAFLGYTIWSLQTQLTRGSGPIFSAIVAVLISIPLLSVLRISAGRWNRFEGLKRTVFRTGLSLAVLTSVVFGSLRIWIGHDIKERIEIAKTEYPGKAEDALLAFLADSTISPRERTDVAIWTLGQIKSQKALPVLKELYRNDPNYHCHHSTELCQYEIHKAIVSIEHNWLGAKEKNWFGSWARLNR